MIFEVKYKKLTILGSQKTRKFGNVYLIQNRLTKEFFVLKELNKTSKNQHLVNQLRFESDFSFDHSSLPKTIDFYEDESNIQLIRSFSKGIPLDEYWKSIKKKNQIITLEKIFKALESPLNELKSKSIVHCDLKPSNLIIEEIEGELRVSIIDFGLAIDFTKEHNRKTLFPLGFAAPELILNQKNAIDFTTDLFSLGIIIYQLFTNELPLKHTNPSVMTNLQITHPILRHRKLPKEIYPIIEKMCKKHLFSLPPNRYSKAELIIFLSDINKQRFQTIEEIIIELIEIQSKFKSNKKSLIEFFSKSNIKRNK